VSAKSTKKRRNARRDRMTEPRTSVDPLHRWRIPSVVPLDRSLDELEGRRSESPESAITPMIGRIYVACSKPLGQLEPGEVRLLLGQCDGLPWIIPLALRFLEQDPLVCGTFYVGDLLEQVLGNEKIWQANPEVIPAIRAAIEQIEEAATVWCPNEDEYPERTWEALRLLEHLEQRGLWPWNPDLAERAPGTRAS
jgi:hypothetical protein